MTTENHRRNAKDDAHVRRLAALLPEVETLLGLPGQQATFSVPSAETKAAVVEANLAWRRDLESQATENRERLLDARVFAASLELFRFVDEEVGTWRQDPDVVSPMAACLVMQLKSLLPSEPEQRFDAIAGRLRAIGPTLETFRATAAAERTSPAPELVIRARDVVDGMGELLRAIGEAARAHTSTGRSVPPSLQTALDAGAEEAAQALETHREWLLNLDATVPAPVGAARYDEILRLRGLDLTANEVLDLGRSLAEEAVIEQARVIRRGFKGQTVESAIAVARKNAPLSLSEAIAWAGELVDQARGFVAEQGAVPVVAPGANNEDERLDVDVLPGPLAPLGAAAVYFPPQPYAPRQDALLLLREPLGPQQEALRELSVADLEHAVAALGFPGQHVQAVWQNRTTTLARRGALLAGLAGPASTWGRDMIEGWSLMAAELMREHHFRHSPSSRLVMVRHSLVQALVAVVDVGLGLGRLSPEQAASFLGRRGGVRLPVARALVRGLLARPTSGLSAIVGKVRIEQLRREAHKRWRGGYSDRRFHSLLMVNGPVPLAYLFERLDEPPAYVSDVVTASGA